jgi:glycosyltransferase involved in cell wall biosynthesis
VGGVGEALRNGETGFLAKPGDTEEFAVAIMRLLSDGALRDKMGTAGRRFVMENFIWNLCAKRMLQVYHEALGT